MTGDNRSRGLGFFPEVDLCCDLGADSARMPEPRDMNKAGTLCAWCKGSSSISDEKRCRPGLLFPERWKRVFGGKTTPVASMAGFEIRTAAWREGPCPG